MIFANSYTKLYAFVFCLFVFCIFKQASVLCRCGLTCKPLRSGPGLILWWFVIPETSPCHPTTGPTHADLFSPPSQMVRLLTIVSRWLWWSGWLRWWYRWFPGRTNLTTVPDHNLQPACRASLDCEYVNQIVRDSSQPNQIKSLALVLKVLGIQTFSTSSNPS